MGVSGGSAGGIALAGSGMSGMGQSIQESQVKKQLKDAAKTTAPTPDNSADQLAAAQEEARRQGLGGRASTILTGLSPQPLASNPSDIFGATSYTNARRLLMGS